MYPVGIQLRTIRYSGASAIESGEGLTVTGRLVASRSLVWDGPPQWRLPTVGAEVEFAPGDPVEFAPPVTDQTGWRLKSGAFIDVSTEGSYTHEYVLIVTTRNGIEVVSHESIGPFIVPTGDLSPYVLDTGLQVGTVAGGVVLVPDLTPRVEALEAALGGASAGLITADDTPAAPAEGESASFFVTSAVVWPAGLEWSTDPDGGVAPAITGTALVSMFTVDGVTRAILGATFPPPPDVTPPTPGTLAASLITSAGFTLTVSGASDERALHATPYAFTTDGTTWSAYQASPVFVASGLAAETGYSCNWRVQDAAGNVSTGTAQTVTTDVGVGMSAFTDFSADTADVAPADWVSAWGAVTATVKTDAGAIGGKVLRLTGTANARRFLRWSAVPTDCTLLEMVARFRMTTWDAAGLTSGAHPLRVLASGSTGSESAYTLSATGGGTDTNEWLFKYVNGTSTTLSTVYAPIAAGEWYWVRLRAAGGTVSAKLWKDGDAEPGTWLATASDSSITTGGGGIGMFMPNEIDFDVVGADWSGAAAPTVAP